MPLTTIGGQEWYRGPQERFKGDIVLGSGWACGPVPGLCVSPGPALNPNFLRFQQPHDLLLQGLMDQRRPAFAVETDSLSPKPLQSALQAPSADPVECPAICDKDRRVPWS